MSEKRKKDDGRMWTGAAEPQRRLLATSEAPNSDDVRRAVAAADQDLSELARPFTTEPTQETLSQSTGS